MKRWCLFFFIAGCILNAVAETHPGWQTAKVLSFDSREWTTPASSGDGTQVRLKCHLVLQAGDKTYVLERDSPREKPPKLVADANVKYVFDGEDILVRDPSGRDYRMKVVKQGAAEANTTFAQANEASAAPVPATDGRILLDMKSNLDGAEIYLNGQLIGQTPASIPIDKGNCILRVQLTGYMAWQKQIMVSGDRMSFYAELTPQDVVLSEPRGGSVAAAARASKKRQ